VTNPAFFVGYSQFEDFFEAFQKGPITEYPVIYLESMVESQPSSIPGVAMLTNLIIASALLGDRAIYWRFRTGGSNSAALDQASANANFDRTEAALGLLKQHAEQQGFKVHRACVTMPLGLAPAYGDTRLLKYSKESDSFELNAQDEATEVLS
jgi:hypothetical protein